MRELSGLTAQGRQKPNGTLNGVFLDRGLRDSTHSLRTVWTDAGSTKSLQLPHQLDSELFGLAGGMLILFLMPSSSTTPVNEIHGFNAGDQLALWSAIAIDGLL